MKRLKGPEIKLPKVKPPKFLVDLYSDLDDRHLLPIVALLIIGIVAIPFVLGSSGGGPEEAESGAAVTTPSLAPGAKQSKMVVVAETPSLRSYKRRLGHLHPKDPFGSKLPTGESTEASSSSSSSESSSTESITEVETSTTESSSSAESSGGSPSTPESGTTESKVTYFTYAIDVRVTPISTAAGKPSKAEPTVRQELPPLTMLPSRDTPALTYIGPSRDGKKAIMLVSTEVTGLFGDSNCIVGSTTCQMLALEEGSPETVVYGPAGRTYKIELLKIKLHFTDHLERAPLGNPKSNRSARPAQLAQIQVEQGVTGQ
jgi:hypothetical protein